MKKSETDKGVSILFVIGSYGGFHIQYSSSSFHICVAFVALTIFFYDVENRLYKILKIK